MPLRRFFVATCFFGAVLTASSFSFPANAAKSVPTDGHMINYLDCKTERRK
jgi:hypothetical protein